MDLSNLRGTIRRLRILEGLSQKQLERGLGLSQHSLSLIENGKRLPSALELAQLAEFFRVQMTDLLEGRIPEKENREGSYLRFLGLEDPKEDSPFQKELRACIAAQAVATYCREEISRGRLIEWSKSLNLPAQDLLNLA